MTEISETIEKNFLNESNSKWFSENLEETIDYTIEKIGQPPFIRRGILYKGLLN